MSTSVVCFTPSPPVLPVKKNGRNTQPSPPPSLDAPPPEKDNVNFKTEPATCREDLPASCGASSEGVSISVCGELREEIFRGLRGEFFVNRLAPIVGNCLTTHVVHGIVPRFSPEEGGTLWPLVYAVAQSPKVILSSGSYVSRMQLITLHLRRALARCAQDVFDGRGDMEGLFPQGPMAADSMASTTPPDVLTTINRIAKELLASSELAVYLCEYMLLGVLRLSPSVSGGTSEKLESRAAGGDGHLRMVISSLLDSLTSALYSAGDSQSPLAATPALKPSSCADSQKCKFKSCECASVGNSVDTVGGENFRCTLGTFLTEQLSEQGSNLPESTAEDPKARLRAALSSAAATDVRRAGERCLRVVSADVRLKLRELLSPLLGQSATGVPRSPSPPKPSLDGSLQLCTASPRLLLMQHAAEAVGTRMSLTTVSLAQPPAHACFTNDTFRAAEIMSERRRATRVSRGQSSGVRDYDGGGGVEVEKFDRPQDTILPIIPLLEYLRSSDSSQAPVRGAENTSCGVTAVALELAPKTGLVEAILLSLLSSHFSALQRLLADPVCPTSTTEHRTQPSAAESESINEWSSTSSAPPARPDTPLPPLGRCDSFHARHVLLAIMPRVVMDAALISVSDRIAFHGLDLDSAMDTEVNTKFTIKSGMPSLFTGWREKERCRTVRRAAQRWLDRVKTRTDIDHKCESVLSAMRLAKVPLDLIPTLLPDLFDREPSSSCLPFNVSVKESISRTRPFVPLSVALATPAMQYRQYLLNRGEGEILQLELLVRLRGELALLFLGFDVRSRLLEQMRKGLEQYWSVGACAAARAEMCGGLWFSVDLRPPGTPSRATPRGRMQASLSQSISSLGTDVVSYVQHRDEAAVAQILASRCRTARGVHLLTTTEVKGAKVASAPPFSRQMVRRSTYGRSGHSPTSRQEKLCSHAHPAEFSPRTPSSPLITAATSRKENTAIWEAMLQFELRRRRKEEVMLAKCRHADLCCAQQSEAEESSEPEGSEEVTARQLLKEGGSVGGRRAIDPKILTLLLNKTVHFSSSELPHNVWDALRRTLHRHIIEGTPTARIALRAPVTEPPVGGKEKGSAQRFYYSLADKIASFAAREFARGSRNGGVECGAKGPIVGGPSARFKLERPLFTAAGDFLLCAIDGSYYFPAKVPVSGRDRIPRPPLPQTSSSEGEEDSHSHNTPTVKAQQWTLAEEMIKLLSVTEALVGPRDAAAVESVRALEALTFAGSCRAQARVENVGATDSVSQQVVVTTAPPLANVTAAVQTCQKGRFDLFQISPLTQLYDCIETLQRHEKSPLSESIAEMPSPLLGADGRQLFSPSTINETKYGGEGIVGRDFKSFKQSAKKIKSAQRAVPWTFSS